MAPRSLGRGADGSRLNPAEIRVPTRSRKQCRSTARSVTLTGPLGRRPHDPTVRACPPLGSVQRLLGGLILGKEGSPLRHLPTGRIKLHEARESLGTDLAWGAKLAPQLLCLVRHEWEQEYGMAG